MNPPTTLRDTSLLATGRCRSTEEQRASEDPAGGAQYRPLSEARSLLVQAAVGCSYNECRFCGMYRHLRFRVRRIEHVRADVKWAREHVPDVRTVVLSNPAGNVLPLAGVLPRDKVALLEALDDALRGPDEAAFVPESLRGL